jgi:crossover junction endodeoxyribonuclease RuvC
MAHARGVVLLAAQERGLPLGEVAPAQAKKALTGNGRATKRQVQLAVMECCGLDRAPTPADVSDAIAIALAYARRVPSH